MTQLVQNEHGERLIPAREDPIIQEMLRQGYTDSKILFRTVFPENFDRPFSDLHDQIIDLVDECLFLVEDGCKRICICAPRGIGKTTMARAIAAKMILYCQSKFIPYVSKSATFSEMQTEALKSDLMESQLVRDIFGNIKVVKDGSIDESFSKKAFICNVDTHQTFILPRGSGQQIRGLLWKRFRPDGLIFDDLEDTETIDNEDQRRKRKEWFYGDALKVFQTGTTGWNRGWIIYIDTLKHEDSLMAELLESDKWEKLQLSICDENYKSLAPDFMTDEEIKDEVDEARAVGLLDVFARERMSMTISKEDASFKQDMWKYYNETGEEFVKQKIDMESVVIVDPSKTAKPKSDPTGYVVWGVNMKINRLHMRYASQERLEPDEQVDRALELAIAFGAHVIGVECTGLGTFATFRYETECSRRGLAIEIVSLTAKRGTGELSGIGGGKRARVLSLLPYYRRGQVLHNEVGVGAYELQLLGYPKSKHWHLMDAAGYITWMMDEGGRYFAYEPSEEEDAKMVEAEFKELEADYEPALEDGWQLV